MERPVGSQHEFGITRVPIEWFPADSGAGAYFTRELAALRRLPDDESEVRVAHVTFGPNAQTKHHYHTGLQVLWFLSGSGHVAMFDRDPLNCGPGDIVVVDPYVEHWHGASDDGGTAHLAITAGSTCWEHEPRWHQRISRSTPH